MLNLINPLRKYTFNKRYKPFQQEDLDFLIANKDLYTITEIAVLMNRSCKTLFKYAKHFGIKSSVKSRNRSYLSKVRIAKILESFSLNHDLKTTAICNNVSLSSVSRILSAHWFFKVRSESTKTLVLTSKV